MKQIVENVPFGSLRSGDVVQAGISRVGTVNVEREFPDPPKPPKIAAGTTGTAIVNGKRIHGMIDEDGDFNYLEHDPYDDVTREYTTTKDFVPDSDAVEQVLLPRITRERFIETLHKTVSDNRLDIDSGPLGTLVVFAADRLGLY